MRFGLNHSRPPRGRLFVAFITAALALPWAAHTHGHSSGPAEGGVNAVLGPLPPALSSLRVQLRTTLAPQLLVANPTDQILTVNDEAGRPFLRIGPDGTEADLGAAAFHRTNTLMAPGAFAAEASEQPRWATVEASPNWGWFDLRLRTEAIEPPHPVVDAAVREQVGQWSIPVRLGDTDSVISGHFEYVPAPAGTVQARIVDMGALKGQALLRAMPGSSRPGLFVSYRGESPLTLMGEQEEPFLRFSPDGVEVNRHSPTWAQIAPAGAPRFVAGKDGADTDWVKVSGSRSYGWIDPRAAYSGQVEDPSRSSVVKRWEIPIRIGDRSSLIQGETDWLPIQSVADKGL